MGSARAAVARFQREPNVECAPLTRFQRHGNGQPSVVTREGLGARDDRGSFPSIQARGREPQRVAMRAATNVALRRGDHSANLEHRAEVRIQPKLQGQLDPALEVRLQRDPLEHRAGEHLALEAHPQRLRREDLLGAQLELGVGQLERRRRSRRIGRDERPGRPAAQRELVSEQMPAVVEVKAQRMIGLDRQATVSKRDAEAVACLDYCRLGEIDELRHGADERADRLSATLLTLARVCPHRRTANPASAAELRCASL
jgi:hypothetical protein